MPQYEYKVVPAPTRGQKAKGVKTAEGRFALSVEGVLNQMGAEGWEYLRAELLPSDERTGLTGSTINWRNVLVFRRAHPADAELFQPRILDATARVAPAPLIPVPEPAATPASVPLVGAADAHAADAPVPEAPRMATGAERILKDNGVEELSDVAGMTAALKSRAERQSLSTGDASDEGYESDMPEDGRPGDEGIDDEVTEDTAKA